MPFSSEILVQIVSFAFIVIVVFLALRAFMLWYWRIGEMVNALKEINKNIKLIVKEQTPKLLTETNTVANSKSVTTEHFNEPLEL
ncbi:MAG: hypothetical protein COB35_13460 [Gammaproteobacteria bacterium]|nr:MAG: hypothetical protein COB35_13460 [Gammaproteobacteria bacterium]